MPIETKKIVAAVEQAKKNAKKRKFTQAFDLIIKLRDVDLKKPENRINELIELPNQAGKAIKVCVIASGVLAVNAKSAGADLVLEKEALEKLGENKKEAKKLADDYDFFIAEAPLMPTIGKSLGTVLGPRGKMPTPIPLNAAVEPVLTKHRKTARIRIKDQPIIQCRIGDENMPDEKIAENVQAVVARLEQKLEKGKRNIHKAYLKESMGPLINVEL
jgi:large subunit ribosomal protein L1